MRSYTESCSIPENISLGIIDGSDADSGTCVEYGIAINSGLKTIMIRTDFRNSFDEEVSVNAMLAGKGTVFIYELCFVTDLDQIGLYFKKLALQIHEAIESIF